MRPNTIQLYKFMTSSGGNWRNSFYVYDPCHSGEAVLVAFDRDAQPVAIRAEKLCLLAGEFLDFSECRVTLSVEEFRDIYGQYLLWHTSSDVDALAILCGSEEGGDTS